MWCASFGFLCCISLLHVFSIDNGILNNVFVCSFDEAMQTLRSVAGQDTDDLLEVFVEMRGHLYLHAGSLLLKLAQDGQESWRRVRDLAALCYLVAYQVRAYQQPASALLDRRQTRVHSLQHPSTLNPLSVLSLFHQVQRPKAKMTKRDQSHPQLVELLANHRQSQAGHMLFNLSADASTLIKEVCSCSLQHKYNVSIEFFFLCFYYLISIQFYLLTHPCDDFCAQVVEAFANPIGQDSLIELLFGPQVYAASSFIANDDIHALKVMAPDLLQLAKWDSGRIIHL